MSTVPPNTPEPQDPTARPAGDPTPPVTSPPAYDPAAQPAYGAPAPQQAGYAPAPGYTGAPKGKPKGPSTLGLIALLAALAAVIIGSILVGLGGSQLGALAQYIDPQTGQALPGADTSEANAIAAAGGIQVVLGWLAFVALGLWGLIQGIIATVQNKGRALGITAIVLAVLGSIVVLIVMTVAIAVAAAPYVPTS